MTKSGRQKIVVGIIYNQLRDKVLLSRRSLNAHQGGLMEFPGGKSQPGETPMQTLNRELMEEIGIEIVHSHQLIAYDFDYSDRQINLSAWIVDKWLGEPKGNEGQEIKWVSIEHLKKIELPPANEKFIKAMELPQFYLITPDYHSYPVDYIDKIENFIRGGLRLLQYRNPSIPIENHKKIISKLLPICERYDCKLIYNGSIRDAVNLGAHGVHLNSSRLLQSSALMSVSKEFLVAASCHNNKELLHAENLGVDFCVVSSVHKSPSHPHSIAMGWDTFKSLVMGVRIPVYALGGIKPDELEIARINGAHGIAMISGVWDAREPVSIIENMNR